MSYIPSQTIIKAIRQETQARIINDMDNNINNIRMRTDRINVVTTGFSNRRYIIISNALKRDKAKFSRLTLQYPENNNKTFVSNRKHQNQ